MSKENFFCVQNKKKRKTKCPFLPINSVMSVRLLSSHNDNKKRTAVTVGNGKWLTTEAKILVVRVSWQRGKVRCNSQWI